jgi:TRAP-type uncharacterized transport system fused permease subunit
VFCYSPALLLVLPGTTWADFFQTTLSCAAGVFVIGIAFTGYHTRPIGMPVRLLLGLAGLLLVSPGTYSDLLALAIAGPILAYGYLGGRAPARPA